MNKTIYIMTFQRLKSYINGSNKDGRTEQKHLLKSMLTQNYIYNTIIERFRMSERYQCRRSKTYRNTRTECV